MAALLGFRGIVRAASVRGEAGLFFLGAAAKRSFRGTAKKDDPQDKPKVAEAVPLSQLSDSFLSGSSAAYLEAMEIDHARGTEVEPSWAAFLGALAASDGGASPAQLAEAYANFAASASKAAAANPHHGALSPAAASSADTMMTKVLALAQSYESLGHRMADLDPLGLQKPEDLRCLRPEFYSLEPKEVINTMLVPERGNGMVSVPVNRTVGDFVDHLRDIYCGKIGYEIAHISDPGEYKISRKYQQPHHTPPTPTID